MNRGWFLALVALVALLLGLQAKLWWGEGGIVQARSLRAKVAEQHAENARLQQRNDALAAEVEDLKSGEAAVEERARSELGMVKPGETFYRVVEPHVETPVLPGGDEPDPPVPPPPAQGPAQ